MSPYFSIFTATYNRAHLLPRLFDSLMEQDFKDFEWVVVDDGSEDETSALIEKFQSQATFPIVFHAQENGGKHRAINAGIMRSSGVLFTSIDSDDYLLPGALRLLHGRWESLKESEKKEVAGLLGLSERVSGELIGHAFPEDHMRMDYISQRSVYKIRGDKQFVYRTEILRHHLYPEFEGENYMDDSVVHTRIATKLPMLTVNKTVAVKDYQATGLSGTRGEDSGRLRKIRSCHGMRLRRLETANNRAKEGLWDLWKEYRDYTRYACHCGYRFSDQAKEVRFKYLWLLSALSGWLRFKGDRRFLRKRGIMQ